MRRCRNHGTAQHSTVLPNLPLLTSRAIPRSCALASCFLVGRAVPSNIRISELGAQRRNFFSYSCQAPSWDGVWGIGGHVKLQARLLGGSCRPVAHAPVHPAALTGKLPATSSNNPSHLCLAVVALPAPQREGPSSTQLQQLTELDASGASHDGVIVCIRNLQLVGRTRALCLQGFTHQVAVYQPGWHALRHGP